MTIDLIHSWVSKSLRHQSWLLWIAIVRAEDWCSKSTIAVSTMKRRSYKCKIWEEETIPSSLITSASSKLSNNLWTHLLQVKAEVTFLSSMLKCIAQSRRSYPLKIHTLTTHKTIDSILSNKTSTFQIVRSWRGQRSYQSIVTASTKNLTLWSRTLSK